MILKEEECCAVFEASQQKSQKEKVDHHLHAMIPFIDLIRERESADSSPSVYQSLPDHRLLSSSDSSETQKVRSIVCNARNRSREATSLIKSPRQEERSEEVLFSERESKGILIRVRNRLLRVSKRRNSHLLERKEVGEENAENEYDDEKEEDENKATKEIRTPSLSPQQNPEMKLLQKPEDEWKERTSSTKSPSNLILSHLQEQQQHLKNHQQCFCVRKRSRRRRHLFLHRHYQRTLSPSSVIMHSYSSSKKTVVSTMFHCLLLSVFLLISSCHASSSSPSSISPATSLFASSTSSKGNSPPKFTTDPNGPGSEIVIPVKEGVQSVGREILRISGEDSDGDDLTFGIKYDTDSDIVNITNHVPTRNSAIVFLAKELDREKKDSYSIVLTLTDGKLGRDKFVTKTIFIVVEDINDNDPIFRPFRPAISVVENSRPQIIESVEAYDLDQGRFGQVLYRLQEVDKLQGPDTFKIETMEGKGVISLTGHLDYEKKSLYNLRILAIDRGAEEERRTATATLQVNVKDVNDNAPHFTKKIYTGGVTTDADYGTVVMQVKAVDLDSGSNAEVKYYINGTIKRKLSVGFENLRLDPFILNRRNGEISLNFDPRKDMKGYFEFDILANDSAGFYDTSRVFIYLLREDQRVRFVLRLAPQELREKLDNFRDVLSNITGAIVNVDTYKFHETFDGNVDKRRTDLYLHFVNPKDNSIMEVKSVLTLIDKNSEYLDELYKDFNVLLSEPAVDRQEFVLWEDQVKACLIGSTAFLALLLLLVTCLCLSQRVRYERLLKAAATVPGIYPRDTRVRPGVVVQGRTHVPNTNIHADEGSNPIWMTGYDNEWYEKGDDEGISDRSTGNSLDENAVTEPGGTSEEEPTTPTDSLNGSGRCSDSIKNDRTSLCRAMRQDNTTSKMLTSRLPLSSLRVPSKNRQQLKSINNNHNSLKNHQQLHQAGQYNRMSGTGQQAGGKKLSQAPRPPISLPIPIHSSSDGISLPHGMMTTLPNDHTFTSLHHQKGNHSTPTSPSRTTSSSAQLNSIQHLQQQQHNQHLQQHNTLGRHSEVTCKNSINTIYISSNANTSPSNNAHLHSPSSPSASHHLANNLSMISLETTEL